MKRIILTLVAMALGAQAATVIFPVQQHTAANNRRNIIITPQSGTRTLGTNVVGGGPIVLAGTNSLPSTNLVAGTYRMTIDGISGYVTFVVPDTNGVLSVADLDTSTPAAADAPSFASVFWRKDGLLAGTNTTYRTNAGVVYIDTTSGTAGAVTNNETRDLVLRGNNTLGGPGGEGVSTNTTVIDGDLRLHVSQVNRRRILAGPPDSPESEGHIDFAMGTDAVMRINSGDNNSLELISEGEIAAYPSGQPFRVYGDLAVTGAITGTIQGGQIFNESIPTNKLDATVYALLIAAQRAITNWHAPLINLTNVGSMSLTNLEFRGPNGIRFTDTNGAVVLEIPRDGSAVIVSNLIAYLRLQIGPTNATSGTNWLNFVTQFGVGRTNTISDGGSVLNGVALTNSTVTIGTNAIFGSTNATVQYGGANTLVVMNGRVGIGVASPVDKLQVGGGIYGNANIFAESQVYANGYFAHWAKNRWVSSADGAMMWTKADGTTSLMSNTNGTLTVPLGVVIRTNTAEPAAVAGAAQLYSLDVSGVPELFGQGGDGTETQLTSHPGDAPPQLYGDDAFELEPYMLRESNPFVTNGVIRFVNVTRMARQTELMNRAILYLLGTRNANTSNAVTKLQAQSPAERQVITRESFAEYNTRTGAKLTPKVWEAEQAKLQAEYDANRAAAIATNAIYVAEGNTNLVTVPPVADVRRAKPGWMTR